MNRTSIFPNHAKLSVNGVVQKGTFKDDNENIPDLNCDWNISVYYGSTVKFSDFDLYSGNTYAGYKIGDADMVSQTAFSDVEFNMASANTTVLFYLKGNEYTITFDADGGVFGEQDSEITVAVDKHTATRKYQMHTASDVSLCLLYTSPSPRDRQKSRMPSSA